MNEIITIIQGYNTEKEILVKCLVNMDNLTYTSNIEKREEIKDRLSIIDKKIEDIYKNYFTPIPVDKKQSNEI